MERLKFDSQGRLASADSVVVGQNRPESKSKSEVDIELLTSKALQFLNSKKIEPIIDDSPWSLYQENKKLSPLKFSNNKTQEQVVIEIKDLINQGNKIIFLRGVCGTGKSAIALNLARLIGRASIVVPIKNLQKQYEQDYMSKKHLIKPNGEILKIAMITGRDNHDSIINPGVSCADPLLPDTIKFTEKNYNLLKDYYQQNPYIKSKSLPDLKTLKRISIAPANPHWSPILSATYELEFMKDAKKKRYKGTDNREYIFYHRKPGCSYYDQYLSYTDADVIIFNAAKYKVELALGRKPATEIDVIDEADEFLDSLANQIELNLTHLATAFKILKPENESLEETIRSIIDLIELEHKNKLALGVNEEEIFQVRDTKIGKVLEKLAKNENLQAEILLDDSNYANKALEAAELFPELEETFATFKRFEGDLYISLLSTNLSQKVQDLIKKNKTIVFMSGTLHSPEVLEKIFGIKNFKVVEAETTQQGAIDIIRTGKEFDCRHSILSGRSSGRKDYLEALDAAIKKSIKPVLVHVNAFSDLPSEEEKHKFNLSVISREELRSQQEQDKSNELVTRFKSKQIPILYSTRASRGVDFPGDTCNSIVFTKYPNPNTKDIFWKILEKTHADSFWDFYRDKAHREFLQRIYRALRFKGDHVYIASPDSRVLDAVRQIQLQAR